MDCFVALLLAMTMVGSAPYGVRPQRRDDRIEPICQRRRAGLQDQRRFYLDNASVADSRNLAPARPLSDFVGDYFLAAPRRQDHVGCCRAHHIGQDDAVLGGLLRSQLWQDVLAARDLDQFRNPADAADQRIVPFLEIHYWFGQGPRSRSELCQTLLISG